MKNDVKTSVVRMDAAILKTLLTEEVKETLATDYQVSPQANKSFGVADLWNIRRNARTAASLAKR